MTLDEAIKHCEEKAEELRKKATYINENPNPTEFFANSIREAEDCIECAKEHEQLAEWLKELKKRRENTPNCDKCVYKEGWFVPQ